MRRWLAAFLAFVLLGTASPGRAEDEHALIALPADVMQFLGIYAAEDLGFWKGAFVHEHKREALAVLRAHFPQSA